MEVDARLLTLIRSVRETYGRVGKEKLKVLVSAYAQSLGIPGYGSTKIGKIIKRNRYFFAGPKRRKKSRFARLRVRRVGKDVQPGYLEMDSLVVYVGTAKLTFVTLVDVVTKVAYAERVKSQRSEHALSVLLAFTRRYPIKIHTIQTDNGSEFLGAFQRDLETQGITHLFTYPHTPRVNGVVERFNRTIQEEFLERCEAYWYDLLLGDQKLTHYLTWYNETRPHAALKYLSPLKYAEQYM
jgi:transposase InsO family protein